MIQKYDCVITDVSTTETEKCVKRNMEKYINNSQLGKKLNLNLKKNIL